MSEGDKLGLAVAAVFLFVLMLLLLRELGVLT